MLIFKTSPNYFKNQKFLKKIDRNQTLNLQLSSRLNSSSSSLHKTNWDLLVSAGTVPKAGEVQGEGEELLLALVAAIKAKQPSLQERLIG